MAMSNSRLAYKDCYKLYERALSDPKGVKVKFAKHDDAWHFRHRMHHARKLDRKDNEKVYSEDHPMHGLSDFDKITARVEKDGDGYWLRLTKIEAENFEILSLAEEEQKEEKIEVVVNKQITFVPVAPIRMRRL